MITATDWKPVEKGTLRGFCSLHLSSSGLILHDCAVHKKPDGSRWVGLPSRPQLNAEKRQLIGPNGKGLFVPVVEIKGAAERARFQETALDAIDRGEGARND